MSRLRASHSLQLLQLLGFFVQLSYCTGLTNILHCVILISCSESLIRTAFQCLQLVVTDFLPTMPCTCLQIVVDVAGSFGLQNQELNISLTSIGLLVSEWFFFSVMGFLSYHASLFNFTCIYFADTAKTSLIDLWLSFSLSVSFC